MIGATKLLGLLLGVGVPGPDEAPQVRVHLDRTTATVGEPLILEDLPATLEAHRQLRQVSPTRFSDTDLYKVVLGATLKVNPFRQLSPSDIRRLCIEQHHAQVLLLQWAHL